jgi:hypothetical protein
MPQYFKALATIMAWVLWLSALVTGLSTFAMGLINGVLYGSGPVPMVFAAFFAVSLAMGVGSIVVMLLRKKME